MPLLQTIVLDSASLIHSAKSERCGRESSETMMNEMSEQTMNVMSEQTMNVMSEQTMTNSARLNLDAS